MLLKINTKKLRLALLYIVAFFVVYESGSIPSIVSLSDLFIDKILLLFFIFIVVCLSIKKTNIIKSIVHWMLIFIILCILNSIKSLDTTFILLYRLLLFLTLYLVLSYSKTYRIDFDGIICRIIFIISIISLFIYILVHILVIPIPSNFFYLNDKGLKYFSYFWIYFDQGYPNSQFGLNLFRMTGPFWEPGVFQIFLNYALYRFIFRKRVNILAVSVLILDIILTMSAAGFVCAISIVVFKITTLNKFTNKSKLIISFFIVLFAISLITFVIISKFSETYENKSSAFIRFNDFILATKIFIENPILGIGFNNTKPFELSNMYNGTQFLGNSNGFMTIAYTTGIIGLAFIILPFIKNINNSYRQTKKYKIFYTFMILFFNIVEPVYYFPFMLYILAKSYHSMCWFTFKKHT